MLIDVEGVLDGTFMGLTEGSLVPNSGGRTLTYLGGDGNDIYLIEGGGNLVNGDFNMDGNWDCSDVNALVAEIAAGTNDAAFDLNGDGVVNESDLTGADTGWLAVGGENNPGDTGGNAFLVGDANLDGFVDVSDFNVWNANNFTATPAWCSGDFNADGFVDVSDFNAWNANNFSSSADVAAVPEPGGLELLLVFGLLPFLRRRS